MKLQSLNIKKLRKRSIIVIRKLLKQYNIGYSICEDKERLLDRLSEIQYFANKIKIYSRYDYSL